MQAGSPLEDTLAMYRAAGSLTGEIDDSIDRRIRNQSRPAKVTSTWGSFSKRMAEMRRVENGPHLKHSIGGRLDSAHGPVASNLGYVF